MTQNNTHSLVHRCVGQVWAWCDWVPNSGCHRLNWRGRQSTLPVSRGTLGPLWVHMVSAEFIQSLLCRSQAPTPRCCQMGPLWAPRDCHILCHIPCHVPCHVPSSSSKPAGIPGRGMVLHIKSLSPLGLWGPHLLLLDPDVKGSCNWARPRLSWPGQSPYFISWLGP